MPANDGDPIRRQVRVKLIPLTASLAQSVGLSLEELRAVIAGTRTPTPRQRQRLLERVRMP